MIITTVRHGRTKRDTENLIAHLRKEIGQTSRVVKIGNVALSDEDSAIAYMETMRDASAATVAMHHITISPVIRMSDEQRDEAVRRILSALGADDHPFVLWEHDGKARSAKAADQHFHLAVGHVGPDGKAIDDSGSFRKLEAVARSIEADIGEDLTHSRRTAAVAATLREMGRADVADALQVPSELPKAAMSSATRAVASRAGIDLPGMQAAVRTAWTAADNGVAFRNALIEQGLDVRPGKKPGVFIVAGGDVEIGALDRIVRQKRAAVAARMETPDAKEKRDVEAVSSGPDIQIDAPDPRGRGQAPAPARAAGGERPGGRPARRDQGNPGSDPARAAARDDGDRRPRQEGRRPRRKAADAVAIRKLADVGKDERLKALAADIRQRARPAVDKVLADIARMRQEATAAIAKGFVAPAPDDDLRRARRLHDDAERKVRAAIYATRKPEAAARAVVKSDMPRGLWAWVSGRQSAWRRDVAAAQCEIARIRDVIERKRTASTDLVRMNSRMEKTYGAEVAEARRRHDQAAARALRDREILDAAVAMLGAMPALARQGLQAVLRAAQEAVEAERRRQEQEAARRLQQARRDVPTDSEAYRPGPSFR